MQGLSRANAPLGLSPPEVRRFLVEALDQWANVDGPKPAGWLQETWDARVPASELEATAAELLGARTDEEKTAARQALEPLVARGLLRRAGGWLLPLTITRPEEARDKIAWDFLVEVLVTLGGDVADLRCEVWGSTLTLLVCESCTVVFRPLRRAHGTRQCPDCGARRPRAPVLGERGSTLSDVYAGRSVRVRAAKERDDNLVLSLKTKTVSLCRECRKLMIRDRPAEVCSDACESSKRRRL